MPIRPAVRINLAILIQGGTGEGRGDRLTNIDGVIGSNFHDGLLGDAFVNVMYGNAGNDLIETLEGEDFLFGGAGGDQLNAGGR